jgi:hypothetical protein
MFDLALAAREQTAALQEERNAAMTELTALKAKIEKSDRFDKEAENYTRELTYTGATIYREKGSPGPQGKSPYFCPTCFSNKQLSILNPAKGENTRLGDCNHTCAICKTTMPLAVLYPE